MTSEYNRYDNKQQEKERHYENKFSVLQRERGGEAIEGWEEAHAQVPQDGTTQAEVNCPSTHAVGGRGTESGKVPEGLAHSQ